ncbi:hypothetical protein BRADI_4g14496v3 [Brachypodium distachyon]|uniref:Uncharacterized protein n=1 Tax=Brachypodium distachyon TaxID=15368 RepID=A0A2K2CMU4_BRADI|nr:hypothetical protein BRADI_4g14496v3 [Brachypodium distachyon]
MSHGLVRMRAIALENQAILSSPVHWCKIDIELHRIFGCPDLNEHSGEAVKRDRYLS